VISESLSLRPSQRAWDWTFQLHAKPWAHSKISHLNLNLGTHDWIWWWCWCGGALDSNRKREGEKIVVRPPQWPQFVSAILHPLQPQFGCEQICSKIRPGIPNGGHMEQIHCWIVMSSRSTVLYVTVKWIDYKLIDSCKRNGHLGLQWPVTIIPTPTHVVLLPGGQSENIL